MKRSERSIQKRLQKVLNRRGSFKGSKAKTIKDWKYYKMKLSHCDIKEREAKAENDNKIAPKVKINYKKCLK